MVARFIADWVAPIATGRTRRAAVPVALVVGTLLVALNEGAVIIDGHIDAAVIWRAVLDYIVPYVVSSVGYLKAVQHHDIDLG